MRQPILISRQRLVGDPEQIDADVELRVQAETVVQNRVQFVVVSNSKRDSIILRRNCDQNYVVQTIVVKKTSITPDDSGKNCDPHSSSSFEPATII